MRSVLIWILFFIITIFIFNSCSCERNNKEYIPVTEEIKKCNQLINHIDDNYVENIIYLGLDELKIDSITINLYNLPENLKYLKLNNQTIVVNALVVNNFYKNYSIFINNNSDKNNIIKYMSHELIHVKQFETNRLVVYNNQNLIRFDNYIYDTSNLNYNNRPWEIEAISKQDELKNKILSKLY
jgi:hypothetical protein